MPERETNPIRNAWRMLGEAFGLTAEPDPTTEAIAEALSHRDIDRALELALRQAHPLRDEYVWVRDVFDAEVIYELSRRGGDFTSTLFRRTYSITDDGAVTLGDPEQVVAQMTYEPTAATTEDTPASESSVELISDVVPLIEKAVRRDNTVAIKVIDAGQGSSGYYPEETIKRDGPKVFTAGTHMFLDHPTESEAAERPERTVRDLAGTFVSDAAWRDDGPAGPGLYADAQVFSPFREVLDEISPFIGVSIRARGKVEEGDVDGQRTRIITSLEGADSVDFVTRAGRGGSVVSLAESARSEAVRSGARTERVAESTPAVPVIKEAQVADQVNDLQEARGEIATLKTELARLSGLRLLDEARTAASAQLASVDLPAFAKRRILESVTADPAETDGALDRDALTAAVEAQATAWRADLAEAGDYRVEGMGPSGEGDGEGFDPDAVLEAALQDIGLSESTAKLAARGR